MIEQKNKRGRPKSNKLSESSTIRSKRSYQRAFDGGGIRLHTILNGDEVRAIEKFRNTYNFPDNLSLAQLIKIMIVLIEGNEFQRSGHTLNATVFKIDKSHEESL